MTEEADEASDFFLRSLALPAPVSASVGGAGTAIRTVLVPRFENRTKPQPHTVYLIDVCTLTNSWTVARRFSDFTAMHEKLKRRYNKLPKELPRKVANKLSDRVVEQRRASLEEYLQAIVLEDPKIALSDDFFTFLEIQLYDVVAVTNMLLNSLMLQGSASVFKFPLNPTFMYCLDVRLHQVIPQYEAGFDLQEYQTERMYGLATLFRAVQAMPTLKISSAYWNNLQMEAAGNYHDPAFRIAMFESLQSLQIEEIQTSCLKDLATIQPSLVEFHCHNKLSTIYAALVGMVASNNGQLGQWTALRILDLSNNNIMSCDDSLGLAPNLVELNLSHNEITVLSHLDVLTSLTKLDLSHNKLSKLDDVNKVIAQIKSLNLKGNAIESVKGLEKLVSLEVLDLSDNQIAEVNELNRLGGMPLLEKLDVAGNPLGRLYRTHVLATFKDRSLEVTLDGAVASQRETKEILDLQRTWKGQTAVQTAGDREGDIDADNDLSISDNDAVQGEDDENGSQVSNVTPMVPTSGPQDAKRVSQVSLAASANAKRSSQASLISSSTKRVSTASLEGRPRQRRSSTTKSLKQKKRKAVQLTRVVRFDSVVFHRKFRVPFQPGPPVFLPHDPTSHSIADTGVQIPIIDIFGIRDAYSADSTEIGYEQFRELFENSKVDRFTNFFKVLEEMFPIETYDLHAVPLTVPPARHDDGEPLSPTTPSGTASLTIPAADVTTVPVQRRPTAGIQKPRPNTMFVDVTGSSVSSKMHARTPSSSFDLASVQTPKSAVPPVATPKGLADTASVAASSISPPLPKPSLIKEPPASPPKHGGLIKANPLPSLTSLAISRKENVAPLLPPAVPVPVKKEPVPTDSEKALADLRSGALQLVSPMTFEFYAQVVEGAEDCVISVDLIERGLWVISVESGSLLCHWSLQTDWPSPNPVTFAVDGKTNRAIVKLPYPDSLTKAMEIVLEKETDKSDLSSLFTFLHKDFFEPKGLSLEPSTSIKIVKQRSTTNPSPVPLLAAGSATSVESLNATMSAVIVDDTNPLIPADEIMTFICVNMNVKGEDIQAFEWVPVCVYPLAQPEWLGLVVVLLDRVGVMLFPTRSLSAPLESSVQPTKIITIGLAELKAVIVGVFAQYIRLEVDATRTVSMITRDPGKTARLLDNITSRCKQVFPESDQARIGRLSQHVANNSQVMEELKPFIQPPRQANQPQSPVAASRDMDQFLEYILVHERTPTEIVPRTVVMTDMALFLLEEDYVGWPAPSFAPVYDFNKQMCYRQLGCFRLHDISNVEINDSWPPEIMVSFEEFQLPTRSLSNTVPSTALLNNSATPRRWRLVCSNASQRDHFVRMLKQKWLELFGQSLKVNIKKSL